MSAEHMTPEQELERLRRERTAIAERLGVDPARPLAIIGVLDKWKGERDAAKTRAEWAEDRMQRVYAALDAVGAPITEPCDTLIDVSGVRTLAAHERILAIGKVVP